MVGSGNLHQPFFFCFFLYFVRFFFVEGDFGPLAEALWLLDVMTLLIDGPKPRG